MRRLSIAWGLFATFLTGCGDDGPAPPAAEVDADLEPPADCTGEYAWDFTSGPGEMEAGGQEYLCWEGAAPRGGYAVGISNLLLQGSSVLHHLVLMRGDLGLATCEGVTFVSPFVFAGGPGTEALEMPDGTGIAIEDGEPFILQLHVLNATDDARSYDAGVRVCLADAVDQVADQLHFNQTELSIPDDGAEHGFGDTCAVSGEYTFFASWPHMHRIGTSIRIDLDGSAIADVPEWDFQDQRIYPLGEPITATDPELTISCT